MSRVIDIPWQLAVGGDLSIATVPGPRPLAVRIVNAYVARIYRVAPHDALVSAAFQKVVHMLQRPQSLFAPRILWRVLFNPSAARRGGAGDASRCRARRHVNRAPDQRRHGCAAGWLRWASQRPRGSAGALVRTL